MTALFFQGPRVRLRPIERIDLPRYQDLLSDPEISLLYGGLGVPSTMSRTERWFENGGADVNDRQIRLGIEAEGTLIGALSLTNDANLADRCARFGIVIGDRAYQRKGYGREASILFLDYAFAVLGYHKINLDVYAYNAPAIALYRSIGFADEGRRRETHWSRGRFWDEVLMGITAEEWWARHGPPPSLSVESHTGS